MSFTKSEYNTQLRLFSTYCRHYFKLSDYCLKFEKKNRYSTGDDVIIKVEPDKSALQKIHFFPERDVLRYIESKKLVQTIDSIFEKIEDRCGEEARDVLWDYYVKNMPISEVVDEYQISSERTLARKISEWMHQVIDEEWELK